MTQAATLAQLASSGALTADTSGNVGIGTSTPEVNSGFTTLSLNNATNSGVLSFQKAGVRQGLIYNDAGALILYADVVTNSAIKFFTSGASERLRIDSTGNFSASIPSGATPYPAYFCRAWVNFNSTGTVSIYGSGNCSSITDNGVGNFTFNFATAMPDTNYSVTTGPTQSSSNNNGGLMMVFLSAANTYSAPTVGSFRFINVHAINSALGDSTYNCLSVFR